MTSKTWIGTTGTFETPGSWAPATVPGALDDVTISNAGADLIVQAATSATTTINSLHLAANDILDVETGDFDILDNVNTVDAFGTSENDGLITAAQLLTIHGTLLQSATGTIALGTTGLLSLLGTIAGGTIEATDAQSVQIGPGAVGGLDGVAVDAPVFLYDGGQLDLLGDVVLGSTLQIADSTGTQTVLDVDAPVATLSGAGVVSISGTYGNDHIVAGVAGATLDILGVAIEGGGSIGGNGLVLDNAGIIAALFSSPMTIDATSVVNTGTILAQGSTATLLLDSSVTNTGGTLAALDGGTVELGFGVDIQGGLLWNGGPANPGSFLVSSEHASLDGVTLDGVMQVSDNAYLYLSGSIDNLGTFLLTPLGGGIATDLIIDSGAPVTLGGGGVIVLSTGSSRSQIYSGPPATLTNLDNTITGAGNLGASDSSQFTLINDGTIEATSSLAALYVAAVTTTNTGVMLATAGATLDLVNPVYNDGGFVIATGTGAVLSMTGSHFYFGTVSVTNGGTVFARNEDFTGVTFSGDGLVTLDGGILDGTSGDVVIEPGTTLVNTGTSLGLLGTIEILGTLLDIGQSSASLAGLYLDSAQVSLTGTGVLAFGTSGFEQIRPGTGESFTLFNAATIAGAGTIDASSLVNTGTIIASGGTLSLSLGTLFNAGLIVAENGFYSLALGTVPIVNTGGTLAVSAGVQAALAGDDIIGGTLAGGIPLGSGVVGGFHILGSATLDGVTNASYVMVGNNATLVLDNSLVDDVRVEELGGSGTIAIGTTLVTLSGTGDILLLDNAPGAGIEALTPGNTLVNSVRIAGEGTIGGNGLVFRNSGYVSAYGGETLTFIGTVDNTGGLIAAPSVALGGNTYFGTVDLNGVNLTGGILDADGGTIHGTNAILAGATFDGGGAVLLSGGVLDGTANPVFIYAGTTVTNIAGSALGLKGSIDVEGTLLGVGQSASTETFRIESPEVYLTGTGVLALGDSPYNYIVNGGDGSYTLHNAITIAGAGTIGAGNLYLVNTGVINADASTGGNGALTLDPATLTNSGLIEATGTAGLYLAGTVFNTGGTIGFFIGTFTGPGVILEDGSEIIGGTVDGAQATEEPGFLQNVTLDNVTVDGTSVANNAIDTVGSDVLHILDDIDNRGFIYVDNASTLSVDSGVVTLDGGGQVSLGAGADDIIAGLTGATLDNVDNLISVGADQSGTIGGNGLVLRNTGTVAAYSSASVTITGPVFNAGGTLLASGTDALINLNGIYLSGGVLSATGGMINAYNAATLVDTTFTGDGIIQLQGGTLNGQAQPVVIEAGTTLTNAAGSNLYIAGTIDVLGTLLGAGANDSNENLAIQGPGLTLVGSGVVAFDDSSANRILADSDGGTLPLYNFVTITGAFSSLYNVDVTNAGTIDASGTVESYLYGFVTNTGLIEATGTGGLALSKTVINTGGIIAASGTGAFDELAGATIIGGALTSSNGGSFDVTSGVAVLEDVTNLAAITVGSDGTLVLEGSLGGSGAIVLTNNAGAQPHLIVEGSVELSGGGTIELLTGDTNSTVTGGMGGVYPGLSTLVIDQDFAVIGGGRLGDFGNGISNLSIVNSGTIAGTTTAYPMIITSSVTNAGLIEALAGTQALQIDNTVENTAGTILAAAGTVQLINVLVVGGTLATAAGGVVEVPFFDGATLDGVQNTGSFLVNTDAVLSLQTSLVNDGILELFATTSRSSLLIDPGVMTLSGGGTIELLGTNHNAIIEAASTAATLDNVDNVIAGIGTIGDRTNLTLLNAGTIAATGTSALVINSTVTVMTNTGLLEAAATGGLDLSGTILNTGGTIAASGAGAITELAGVTVIGGTLDSAAGGRLDVTSGTAVLDDVTNLGAISVGNGGALVLIDSLANSGTIIGSGSAFDLVVGGSVVTLTGAGTIEIASTVPGSGFGALITGQTLFNADNIITGGGTIGVGTGSAAHTLALINAGTIIASYALQPLTIDATSLLNSGVIEQTGAGRLVFDTAITNLGQITAAGTQVLTLGGTIINEGGTLIAAAGGTFALSGADVQGGLITGPGSFSVAGSTFDGSAAPVTIANATSVTVVTGQTLALLGSLDNAGTLALPATSGFASLAIDPGEAVVSGGGTIVLLENSGIAQIIANGSATLDNVDNLITGGGYVGSGTSLSLINTGTIAATSDRYALTVSAALGVTNAGLIEATTGAGLAISGLVQNGGGTIAAFGTGANVDLAGLVSGGLLTAGNGGVIAVPFDSTLTLAALTNAATLEVSDLSALDLEGSIVNAGAIVLLAAQAEPSLVIDTTTTLSGGSVIDLGDGPARNDIATGTSATTLYNLDNTIIGGGYIGNGTALSLTNAGTIAATGTTSLVFDSTVTVTTNTGLLEAVNTGGLELAGTILNTGGTIAASGAGAITELAGATIIGGTLDSAAGGVLDVTSGTAVLDDVTNPGAITVGTGGTLVLEDSLANAGQIVLTATGTQVGALLVEGSVALTGGGTIELLTGTAAAGVTGGLGGISLAASTLDNVGDVIAGGGHLGGFGSLAPTLSVINAGTIAATDATYALLLTASVTNTGLIEALGGTLQIGNGAVNTGGTILATAGTVAVTGGTITGGTIAASGSGATVLLDTSEIAGATLATGGGGVILTGTGALFATLDGQAAPIDITAGSTVAVPSGGALYLFGSIVNHGVIFDDATGTAFTDIVIDDTVTTLSGGGTLALSDNSYNHVFNVAGTGGTLVNLDNLIEGAGQIGSTTVGRVLGLINAAGGTIDASDDIALVIRSNGGPVINAGLMEATGSGGLAFYPGTTLQNAGGTLLAAGGTIGLAQGVVLGGTFASTGSGVIAATASAGLTLTGITNTGVLLIGTGDDAAMTGSIVNSGTVALAGAGATLLIPTTDASFSGQGTILLAGGTILAGSAGGTLDNLDNLITGGGTLGDGTDLVLLNAGTIAGGTAGTLAIDVARLVNTGVIETTGAAGIAFSGIGTLVDAGGVLAADAAAISLAGIEVQGGTLSGAAGFSAANSTLDGAATPLTLAAGTTLGLAGGSGVTLLGTIAGAGTLLAGASGTDQDLILGTPTIVFGATLGLGGTDSFVTTDAAGNTLINTGVMIGYGTASAGGSGPLTLINENLIDADGAGGAPVVFETGAVINAGVIEATGAGIFLVESTITDAGGTLLAAGGTLAVGPGGDLVGGQLTASAGGLIVVGGTGTLDGSGAAPVTIASAVTVTDGSTLDLLGTIDLDATLLLASSETGTATGIVLASPTVTLADGGTLALSASTGNLITGLAGQSETLVNTGAVIAGAGTITAGAGGALTVLNGAGGVIDATGSLTLAGGVILDNAGLLEATGTGDLILGAGLTLSNAGGTVLADGGTVSLAGVVVTGGSLAVGGGGVLAGTGATLDGSTTPVTIAAGTSLDGSDLTLLGTIAILGTLGLAGFVPGFVGSPTLTLIGGGQLVLAPGGTFLGAGETLGTLVNDVTISGSGVIGYDFANSAALGLINTAGGVIDADVAGAALQLGTDGAATTNAGLIEATAGGTLDIATFTTLAQGPTATLLADGGTVTIGEASVITGGSLLAASGGVFLTTGATLDGTAAPLTIGAGAAVTVSDGTVLDLSGTIDLPGTVVLGSGAALLGDAGATEVAAAGGLIAGDGTIGLAGGTSLRLDEGTTGTIAATGTLSLGAGVQVVGGTLTAGPGGTLVAESATLDGSTTPVTIAAGTSLDSAGLTLLGTIALLGTLGVDGFSPGFVGSPTLTLGGGGQLALSTDGTAFLGAAEPPGTLVNAGVTITGAGVIGYDFANSAALGLINTAGGVIDADVAGAALQISTNGAPTTNAGLIEATGGGTLDIETFTTLAQSATGTLLASGGTVVIEEASVVTGGSLLAGAGGTLVLTGFSTLTGGLIGAAGGGQVIDTGAILDGSTTPETIAAGAVLSVPDGLFLEVLGTLDNAGTIAGLATAATGFTDVILTASPTVTLTGGGLVLLSDSPTNRILNASTTPDTLVNVDNTIAGAGQIGSDTLSYQLGLINEADGVIDATGSNALVLAPNGIPVINAGVLEASGTGTLSIKPATTINNAGGTLLAAGGTVLLGAGVDIAGGTLAANGAGQFIVSGLTLDGSAASLINQAALAVAGGDSLSVLGTIANAAAITLGSGTLGATLLVDGTALLTGGGTVTFGTVASQAGLVAAGVAGAALTVADETLQGSFTLGSGLGVTLGAAGVLESTGLLQLATGTAPIVNGGTIEASSGATLAVGGTLVSAAGGVITPNGGTVDFAGADLIGGTVGLGAGVLHVTGDSLFDERSAAGGNQGVLQIDPQATLALAGAFDNVATLALGAGGAALLGETGTLQGGGTVTLQTGDTLLGTLLNLDNLIIGAGTVAGELGLGAAAKLVATGNLALTGSVANGGLLEAAAGGTLALGGTVAGGGTIAAVAGGLVTLAGDVIGGTLASGSGTITVAGLATLDGTGTALVNTGVLTIQSGATLDLLGTLAAAGSLVVGGTLLVGAATTLANTGLLALLPGGVVEGGALLNLTTIAGAGQLGGGQFTLINAAGATIAATTGALTVEAGNGTIGNAGLLAAEGFALSVSAGGFANTGTVAALGAGLTVQANVAPGGTLAGGTWIAAGGATLTLGGTAAITDDAARIVLSGTGSALASGPNATSLTQSLQQIDAGGTLTLGTGTRFAPAGALANAGTLLLAGGTLAMGGTTAFVNSGLITGAGSVTGTIANAGTIAALARNTLQIGPVTGGTLLVGGGADLVLTGAATGGTVDFTGPGTLTIGAVGSFSETIAGFGHGDIIDLAGIGAAGSLAFDPATDVLTLYSVTSQAGTVAAVSVLAELQFAGTLTANDFGFRADATGQGTDVVPCFVAGTRLQTAAGEVAVERLQPGDRVVTPSGLRPVVWRGARRIACARHPRPELVRPVRVAADAFGPGLPARDLRLSPDHAVEWQGVLIPVRCLVNGATIRQEAVDTVHYVHVELDAHDLVQAEGLWTESYLDTGNRGQFEGAAPWQSLHAAFDGDAMPEGACRPWRETGPEVSTAREMLRQQARRIGWTRRAPRLTLAVGGRVLNAARRQRGPHGELHRFLLPAGTGAVTLLSTASVPAVEDPRAADSRSLGACVTGIVFAGRPLALDGPALDVGFYPLEGGTTPRRWMGATGRLVLTPSASPALLEIAVRELRSGWHAPGLSGGLVAHPAAES